MSQDSRDSRMNQSPLAGLRRFVRPRSAAVERCELCSAELAAEHQHLVEPASRQLVCACEPCAILFSGQAGTKYKRVPRRIRALPDFQMTDAQWDSLMIPIQLAFFFNSSPAGRVIALYPSPAGPTESLLALDSWNEIVAANPILREMETDVEALLVKRVGGESEYYLAPVDECYKLVGLIRAHWRGLSGGTEVWREVGQFYASLQARSTPAKEAQRA
ncbi:MAG: hypothetical protein QOF02_400 [Blastocatellia bacterium]|nr:hypothetical protein [Blastocatellia bacterium]